MKQKDDIYGISIGDIIEVGGKKWRAVHVKIQNSEREVYYELIN